MPRLQLDLASSISYLLRGEASTGRFSIKKQGKFAVGGNWVPPATTVGSHLDARTGHLSHWAASFGEALRKRKFQVPRPKSSAPIRSSGCLYMTMIVPVRAPFGGRSSRTNHFSNASPVPGSFSRRAPSLLAIARTVPLQTNSGSAHSTSPQKRSDRKTRGWQLEAA